MSSLAGVSMSDLNTLLVGLFRASGYCGLVLALGLPVFADWVWPPLRSVPRARDLVAVGGVTVVMTTLLTPYFLPGGITGNIQLRQFVLSVLRITAAIVIAAFALMRTDQELRHERVWILGLGVAILLTYTLTSDAWGGHFAAVKVLATFAHLTAFVLWIGGLAALIGVVLPAHGVAGMNQSFRIFSPMAATCVAVLVVTGTLHAWLILAESHPTDPGAYLLGTLVKAAAVAVMLVLANVARLHHRRVRSKHALPAHSDLILAAGLTAELASGVVVLGFTAALVHVS